MPIHYPESDWRPTRIERVIRPIKSSTQVVHVETDQGEGYLKALGNPQGDECLAFELVGTRLAKRCGLFVPDFAVVEHNLLEIRRFDGELVPHGQVFLSRALPGNPGGGSAAFLPNLLNPDDVPLLVAFDTWVANTDRFPPKEYFHQDPNWDNIFFVPIAGRFQLTVFDHTHCFAEADLEAALANERYQRDKRVYGAFPEFVEFCSEDGIRRSTGLIRDLKEEEIRAVVSAIPKEWGMGGALVAAWADQVCARREIIEDCILDALFAQTRLDLRQ